MSRTHQQGRLTKQTTIIKAHFSDGEHLEAVQSTLATHQLWLLLWVQMYCTLLLNSVQSLGCLHI